MCFFRSPGHIADKDEASLHYGSEGVSSGDQIQSNSTHIGDKYKASLQYGSEGVSSGDQIQWNSSHIPDN